VTISDVGDGTSRLDYAADAVVGGMVGGVGQRMLTSVSKKMAGQFFGAVDDVLTGKRPAQVAAPAAAAATAAAAGEGAVPTAAAGAPASGQVFRAPAAAGAATSLGGNPLAAALVGAGIALAGVLVGWLAGRRRS
jgi:hypothetical protein